MCNLALMVGTTDIPDWCFFEAFGSAGNSVFTPSPSAEQLALFHSKSPISHVSKVRTLERFSSIVFHPHVVLFCLFFVFQVKTPTLFLLGAKDLRVPVYDGLQV